MKRDIARLLFKEIQCMNEMTEQQWRNKWFEWLKDSWYEQIVEVKHNENIFELRSLQKSERKFILSKSKKYVLVQKVNKHAQLTFWERSEALSRCLHEKETKSALRLLHEVHEHFSFDITFQKTLSRFYWFIRRRDVNKWCKTCSMCQHLRSLKSSQELLSILHLQSLDCLDINYIESFISITKSDLHYIVITVDYFLLEISIEQVIWVSFN